MRPQKSPTKNGKFQSGLNQVYVGKLCVVGTTNMNGSITEKAGTLPDQKKPSLLGFQYTPCLYDKSAATNELKLIFGVRSSFDLTYSYV